MGLKPGKDGLWRCAWVLIYKGGGVDAPRKLHNERICGRVRFSCVVHRKARGTFIYSAGNFRTALYLCVNVFSRGRSPLVSGYSQIMEPYFQRGV